MEFAKFHYTIQLANQLLLAGLRPASELDSITEFGFIPILRLEATNRVHNKCSAVAEMGDRLVTIDIGRKLADGRAPLGVFWWGSEPGPHITQCGLERGLPSHQAAS